MIFGTLVVRLLERRVQQCDMCGMIGRFFALFVVFAFAVASTANAGHMVRMNSSTADGVQMYHVTAMVAEYDAQSCEMEQDCASQSAAMCAAVCTGLLNFVIPERGGASVFHAREDYGPTIIPAVLSHNPGVNLRPPKLRLL
ncbi:hypothetical protein D4A92_24175 (plasmid) [Rhizobium rosettiformans]|uniref:DUF2946 domain-containing protein n=1 Tax=Rhizobium rosettiformans TaxID=1368430 RepID=A0ABX7F2V3_9HYPH|nr:hypothetical protein [Rhizobium rosettiformans]QRF54626.1 hypothetical protein D4A92_24175 [Rhizobium rosettiformans]